MTSDRRNAFLITRYEIGRHEDLFTPATFSRFTPLDDQLTMCRISRIRNRIWGAKYSLNCIHRRVRDFIRGVNNAWCRPLSAHASPKRTRCAAEAVTACKSTNFITEIGV